MSVARNVGFIGLFTLASSSRVIVSVRDEVPEGWTRGSRATADEHMSFVVGLKQQNLAALEARFWAVSDPTSAEYRNFLSADEVGVLVRSADEHHELVSTWLQNVPSNGGRAALAVRADAVVVREFPVQAVEELFQTEIWRFTNDAGGTSLRHWGELSLPAHLLAAVDVIEGIGELPVQEVGRAATAALDEDLPMTIPQTLHMLYGLEEQPEPMPTIQMAVEMSNVVAYFPEDLDTFFQHMDLPDQNITKTIGKFKPGADAGEQSLDVQYLAAVGVGAVNWYETTPHWMFTFASDLNDMDDVPHVVSVSWGSAETAQCGLLGDPSGCMKLGVDEKGYINRVNAEFMKLGLRGISIFVSSGDSGANGRTDPFCSGDRLKPSFPASSPYVTSVGATQLAEPATDVRPGIPACESLTCASGGREVCVSKEYAHFTSGGGFSDAAQIPAYQKDVIEAYMNSGVELPPAAMWNQSGRGYPDVSAMGDKFLVWQTNFTDVNQSIHTGWSVTGGTSAAAPTWAGLVARLVNISLVETGKPLGFINPLLYKMQVEAPSTFTDVIEGDNKETEWCTTTCDDCKGYVAAKGWDPVSGLGTPNFPAMASYVRGLSSARSVVAI